MKQINKWIFVFLAALLIVACEEKEDKIITQNAPKWTVQDQTQYAVNMTVIVQLPEQLKKHETNQDLVAAFVGDECRAVKKINEKGVYFLMIKGREDEQSQITLKYYSVKSSHLYVHNETIKFKVNAAHGTIDDPLTLNLKAIN